MVCFCLQSNTNTRTNTKKKRKAHKKKHTYIKRRWSNPQLKFVEYAEWGDGTFNGVFDVSFVRIPKVTAKLNHDDYKIAYMGI